MPQALSNPIDSDDKADNVKNYTETVNKYLLQQCSELTHYTSANRTGTLIQTHLPKTFGKTSGPSSSNKVCTILIISNRISYGLLAMKEWTDVFLASVKKNSGLFSNTEWLVHLHLNNPIMRDWQIGMFERNLIKSLDKLGKDSGNNIRYCIDFSAWILNATTDKLEPIEDPDGDDSAYKDSIPKMLGTRSERLATIPYGLLRSFGLHKALMLNAGSTNSGKNDIYMIVDVEPTDALNPSHLRNSVAETHPLSGSKSETAMDNRVVCFTETWKKLNSGSSSFNVVYNRLQWKSNHAGSMAAQWYNAKYPEGVPYDMVDGKKVCLRKLDEVKLCMDLAVQEVMTKLVIHMDDASGRSSYPSEPLLGFKMADYSVEQVVNMAGGPKSLIGFEREFIQNHKKIRYVTLTNVMGIGSGEGKSIEKNCKGLTSGAEPSGKRIWTSAWGVLKDIVVAKLNLVNTADGDKPHYEPQVKITVKDIKEMGGIDSGDSPSETVIVEIDPNK